MDYAAEKIRNVFGNCFRPGGLAISRKALEIFPFPQGAKIADIACGEGASLELLTQLGFEAIGLDKSPILLKEALKKGPALEGDFHNLPWPDKSFDGIFCECALSLAQYPAQVLAQCSRVLKKDGALILSDLFIKSLKNEDVDAETSTSGIMRKAQLLNLIEQTGLNVLHFSEYNEELNQLGAQIVWEFASVSAIKDLFACSRGIDCDFINLSYGLFICTPQAQSLRADADYRLGT